MKIQWAFGGGEQTPARINQNEPGYWTVGKDRFESLSEVGQKETVALLGS